MKDLGCKVASRGESHCFVPKSRDISVQHVVWHYLAEMSDCVVAHKEPHMDEEFGLYTEGI